MTQEEFVQRFVLRWISDPARVPEAVERAKEIWAALHETGAVKVKGEPGARKTVDYVARLTEQQTSYFVAAFKAFNLVPDPLKSRDKQKAAKAWLELDPNEATAKRIVEAAKADAKLWRESPPNRARKWFQGWLNETRFDGYEPPAVGPSAAPPGVHPKAHAIAEAKRDIAHWERLKKLNPSDLTYDEILEKARKKLADLEA